MPCAVCDTGTGRGVHNVGRTGQERHYGGIARAFVCGFSRSNLHHAWSNAEFRAGCRQGTAGAAALRATGVAIIGSEPDSTVQGSVGTSRGVIGLATEFEVDSEAVLEAVENYRADTCIENLWAINRAVEAPRQKLFRRINMAPEATRTLVAMRGHLLDMLKSNAALRGVDSDLKHLFISWFNKGFLELRRIDWSSPASVLEKIIDYEVVHEINGWDDLRSRLREDRRCFAFFHPALDNDPLVFVEIALTDRIPDALAPLLLQEREKPVVGRVNTVVFYSISNCHPGLSGITFGNFLIKNVVEELKKEIPALKNFVTLSPVPGFRNWLCSADLAGLVPEKLIDRVKEPVGAVVDTQVYDALLKLCAHYLLRVKSDTLPRDSVARFHLGNGAQLYGIHGGADLSVKGREQSAGIMVNYLYDLPKIEENHEAYFDQGKIAVSKSVSRLLD
jgi:malonyl-CoA decarboxylase